VYQNVSEYAGSRKVWNSGGQRRINAPRRSQRLTDDFELTLDRAPQRIIRKVVIKRTV